MVPQALSEGPFREALEVTRKTAFTAEEWELYERAKMAEQDARGALVIAHEEGKEEGHKSGLTEGKAEGLSEGEIKGRREALLRLLARAKIALTDSDRARIQVCFDVGTLDRWIENVIGASSINDVLT